MPEQVEVDWDIPRSLSPTEGVDRYRVLTPADEPERETPQGEEGHQVEQRS